MPCPWEQQQYSLHWAQTSCSFNVYYEQMEFHITINMILYIVDHDVVFNLIWTKQALSVYDLLFSPVYDLIRAV